MAVYGYARMSTLRQADEGESLEVQGRTITGHAMIHGLTVDRVHVERGVSGAKPLADRPEGKLLLAALQPGDTVITPKLDRMFRSALDALDVLKRLKDGGVTLHMVDLGGDVMGTGISRLVFTILSAVAEAEHDRVRERIAEVKRDQRTRRRYLGGIVPFGWRVEEAGDLVPVPERQEAICHMHELRAQGRSLRAIAAEVTAGGHRVSHQGVKAILDAGRSMKRCIGSAGVSSRS